MAKAAYGHPPDRVACGVWLLPAFLALIGVDSIAGGLGVVGILLALLTVALSAWAAKEGYIAFQEEDFPLSPQPALKPDEQVIVRAFGHFEVEGKEGYFVDLAAAFESFETREHAVLAYVPPSALWPRNQVGMWYIFFRPEDVISTEWGRLFFGTKALPAIRISYRVSGQKAVAYLASPHLDRLIRIWDDINLDAGETR